MQLIQNFGAALWLVMLALSALVKQQLSNVWNLWGWTPTGLVPGEAGVVVVTYTTPSLGAPSTTAPTAAQAALVSEQQAQIFMADADTAAVFVHNWGLPNSYPTFLWPQVIMNKLTGAAADAYASFTFGLTNTNSVTITKGNTTAGTGGTYAVYLRRPHSLGQ